MTLTRLKTLGLASLLASSAFVAAQEDAANRYAQIVMSFPSERTYNYTYHPQDNAVVLELKGTSPAELEALYHYDERLVRRVLIKDMGPAGSELTLVLKDNDVRATITDFSEPFRIIIDLFDRSFNETRDPATGLPLLKDSLLVTDEAKAVGGREPAITMRMVAPSDEAPRAPAPRSGRDEPRRRLLQPIPKEFRNPEQMLSALGKVEAGIGKAWDRFPVYVYRMQTAPYRSEKNQETWMHKNSVKAVDSAEAMADYAAKLFDFGHEGRALVAYQQVLHSAPLIFDRNALHLWRLAEAHLGQGNLTLADGYYQSLREKHPDSPLAGFAALRRLDIRAIQFIERGNQAGFKDLTAQLARIAPGASAELKVQLAIRQAYWSAAQSDAEILKNRDKLPKLAPNTVVALEDAYQNVESQKTAFLAATLILSDILNTEGRFTRQTSEFAASYFKRYHGSATEPYRSHLEARLKTLLNGTIEVQVDKGNYLQAIQTYEDVPAELRAVKDTPRTSWAIAQAYRTLGQPDKAEPFYESAAKLSPPGPDRFRAQFWQAVTAGDVVETLKSPGANKARVTALNNKILATDRAMAATWQALKPEEQRQLYAEMKPQLEATITSPTRLRAPAQIVLSAWSESLGTQVSSSSTDATDWRRHYSPTANTVQLLSDLAARFAVLGQKKEERQARQLLRKINPADVRGDQKAMELWTKELLVLAEDYRKANEYLEAGQIYVFTGSESQDSNGRAEALYKGGLLLYRAGRREEALDAFKKASEDANNLLYADLAKKRLNQLQQ